MRERFTIGVEEEYQLVDAGSGELRSRGAAVRRVDRTGEVAGEVHETMIEIGTPVCLDAGELAVSLRQRRFQAAAAAAAEELEIVAAGTHPFSRTEHQVITDAARPRMLARLFRELLERQSIWGMHIHVAVPEEIDRVLLMNTVRTYAAHLLALSCSSPLVGGKDTGYHSFRTIAWRGYPFAGVPPRFRSATEYREYLAMLLKAGTIPDERTLYWSVRPSARYSTLELRMCDACPGIGDAVAIAALGRAIVVAAAEEALPAIGASLPGSLQDEVLHENAWIAARYGLEALLIAPESPRKQVRIRDAIAELLETVDPIARRLGDAEALKGVSKILEGGTAADRMRERLASGSGLPDLVDWLVEETRTGTGIDRRRARRERS